MRRPRQGCPTAMNRPGVLELEAIAALDWRPVDAAELGGWHLRASAGFTGRANSVLPLGDPDRPLDEALHVVAAWYAERDLPARFQLPLPSSTELDGELDTRGWAAYNPTDVLTADLPLAPPPAPVEVTLSGTPSEAWLAAYHYRGEPLPPVARRLLTSARRQAFASVVVGQQAVAIGRVAVDAGWAGITAMEVDPARRRRGLGGALLGALCEWAAQQGARSAYLQVATENAAGRALYGRHGFRFHHRYRYRRAP